MLPMTESQMHDWPECSTGVRQGVSAAAPAAGAVFAGAPWHRGPEPALITGSEAGQSVWSYAQLAERSAALATRLRAQGLQPGHLVAVPERPGTQLILMLHALAQCDAALLPIRAAADDPAGDALLAGTGAEWVWRSADTDGVNGGRLVRLAPAPVTPGAVPASANWSSPLALVVETSGSSGAPRAAMLTQGNVLAAAALSNRHLGLQTGDTWLCCLPLRHIGGLSILYRCALAGAAVLLHDGFDAGTVAADLASRAVTHLSLVPPMLARLLALGRPPPVTLRVVLVGGQSLSPPLARQAIAAGWPLHVTYGMTETAAQIATSARLVQAPASGVIGQPLAGVELDCSACADGSGRLRVRGRVVMAGYANPERMPGVGLADGWFTTSDLGCRGPDGALQILGRADEVLVTGGVNVHPGRVEAILAEAPGVSEAAVVGVADPVWGQRLVALYRGEATPAALDAWCRVRLPGAERPRLFLPLPELPVLASGKLDRCGLRALAQAAAG
jgi:o-succinylbenzoate---CoA ligase